MPDDDRRPAGSVASQVTFLQAVRLLESQALYERRTNWKPPGETVFEEHELLFFRHSVRFDDPPADVESLQYPGPDAEDQRPVMTVNVMGLAGVLGPLPYTVAETILDRRRYNDTALADFLDIFNHRLISLLYFERKKFRAALDPRPPHHGRVARVLYSFLGLGTPHLRGRALGHDKDRALLAYAGAFVQRYRPACGLERMLSDYLGVAVEVKPFVGEWQTVEPEDRTLLGTRGRNRALGGGALLGARVWNQAARFEVRIGPLDQRAFRAFLPRAREAFPALVSFVRFYVREELGFDVRLRLAAGAMTKLTIGLRAGAFLGWTTWLCGHVAPPNRMDEQVRLAGVR